MAALRLHSMLMLTNYRIALTLFISSLVLIRAAEVSIYSVPADPGWPVIMSAIVPQELKLSASAVYTWTFPTAVNPTCTSNGKANVSPCTGRTVDHVFPNAGAHTIELTITDTSLQQPIRITKQITIEVSTATAQRPEIASVTDEYWSVFVNALYQLKAVGVWDHMAAIHADAFTVGYDQLTKRSCAHGGPSFGPWHRSMLRVLERAVQFAANDSSVGLPYWDWTHTENINLIFSDRRFGPNGNPQNRFIVPSGAFCNDPTATDATKCPKRWPSPQLEGAITRQFDTNTPFSTAADVQGLLAIQGYDAAPFDQQAESFRNYLEGWKNKHGSMHNGAHRWVGGTMKNVTISFNDPVFIIHHAQVDRIYTMWQVAQKCDQGQTTPNCYRPQDNDPDVNVQSPGGASLVGHRLHDQMYPWRLRPVDLLKANVGYKYLNYNEKPQLNAQEQEKKNETTIIDGINHDNQNKNSTIDDNSNNGNNSSVLPPIPNGSILEDNSATHVYATGSIIFAAILSLF